MIREREDENNTATKKLLMMMKKIEIKIIRPEESRISRAHCEMSHDWQSRSA